MGGEWSELGGDYAGGSERKIRREGLRVLARRRRNDEEREKKKEEEEEELNGLGDRCCKSGNWVGDGKN